MLRAVTRADVELLHAWESDHAGWPLNSDRVHHPTTLADDLKRYDEGLRWRAGDTSIPFAVEVGGSWSAPWCSSRC